MKMRIIKGKNYDEMSRMAADVVAAQILLKPNCVLGLATGGSPLGLYKSLIARHNAGELDFAAVRSINLDEYKGLGAESDQSYRYFMNKNLFSHVNIKTENTFVPNGLEEDGDKECARYDALMADMGGTDLQLLGIGHNGHIGFNEPADAFSTGTHCVALAESTIKANTRFFASEADVPRFAYTMGTSGIMHAKTVLLIASGKEKAEIIKKAFTGPVTPQVPASILQLHPNVIFAGDEEALSLL